MSSFRPTEKPASAASWSISLPIFPYPTMARFLGMVCFRFAEKQTSHLSIGIDGSEQFALCYFFLERVRHVNAARPKKKRLAPGRRQHGDIGRERNHRRRETVERGELHRRQRQDFSYLGAVSNGGAQCLI